MNPTGKILLTLLLLLAARMAKAQDETTLYSEGGVRFSYVFSDDNESKMNSKNALVKKWTFQFKLKNDCGRDINVQNSFAARWTDLAVDLPAGWKKEDLGIVRTRTGTLKNSSTWSYYVTIYTPDIFQGELVRKIYLTYVTGSGRFTELKTSDTANDTYDKHAAKARNFEAGGNYSEALDEWQRALNKKPTDTYAQGKIRELEGKVKSQNLRKYQLANDADQKKRNVQEEKDRNEQFSLMADGAGIMYGKMGESYETDKNKFSHGSTRLTFSCGYSFALMPAYANTKFESNYGSGYNYDYYTDTKSIPTLNLDLGVQFWPYYGENAGIGILAEGFGGYLPLAGSNASYQYSYGGQVFAGVSKVKLSAKFMMGDRGASNHWTFSSGSTKSVEDTEGATKFTRLSVGPRFTFNTGAHPNRNLEIFYVMEQYPNMQKIKGSGVNVTYSTDNRLRIYADYMFSAARMGVIQNDLNEGVSNTGTLIVFGVVRTFDSFGQK